MDTDAVRATLEHAYEEQDAVPRDEALRAFEALRALLSQGEVRAASPRGDGWVAHAWVKKGILLGFRLGETKDYSIDSGFRYFDKSTFPLSDLSQSDGVRIVPGGSTIRSGSYVAPGVVCMPPMYINVGAYVDRGTMVDSNALVGSCAQVGCRVHVSAGVQIGGVLEPVGALPVIVEDGVLLGGGAGVYEGTRVCQDAVIAPGTVLTRGTHLFDLPNARPLRPPRGEPLTVPPRAVVVPGSRPAGGAFARENGLSVYAAVIVKYRDAGTDASVALEDALR